MRKLIAIAFISILLLSSYSFAQDNEELHKLLTKESIYKCADYALNSTILIPRYYREGKIDSLKLILDFWEDRCGENSRILYTRLLLAIKDGEFTDDMYDEEIIDELISYRRIMESINQYGYPQRSFFGGGFDPEVRRKFDEFTEKLARDGLANSDTTSVAFLLGLFFCREFNVFFEKLKTPMYEGTKLQQYYFRTVEYLKNDRGWQTHYAVSVGCWYPVGNLNVLGRHPEVGFSFGRKKSKLQYDLSFTTRFQHADTVYTVEQDGFLDSTDNFTSFYIGLDCAYEVARFGPIHVNMLAGGGLDLIHTVDDRDDDERKKVLSSYNFNAGFGGRLYLNKYRTWYVSLCGKFNLVNYNTGAGTDLSGNAFTVGVTIGHLSFGKANEALRLLNFFE